jgi:hypothetical protein
MCGSLTAFLWILYPIAWGVSEGGNVIAPDSEAVFYGILDFLAKPVFGALLIWGHKDIDLARLGLNIRDYDGDALLHDKKVCLPLLGGSMKSLDANMLQEHAPVVASGANNGHSTVHNNGETVAV